MKLGKTVFMLILSIALCSSLHANISVSNKTIFDDLNESISNTPIGATTFITNTINTNYIMSDNAQSIVIEGNDMMMTTGGNLAGFQYVAPIDEAKTHPFRYTEVSFLIAFPFVYTYGILVVAGFDALDSMFPSSGTPHSELETSQLIFSFAAAIFASAAVAYDNYSRVYGKRAKETSLNIGFAPIIETMDNGKTSTGFLFSFSYPW